jgi:hypothetical protein
MISAVSRAIVYQNKDRKEDGAECFLDYSADRFFTNLFSRAFKRVRSAIRKVARTNTFKMRCA